MNARRTRILCVEDDRDTASLICEELEDRGFDVIAAYDGHDGLASILKDPPDIVLSDIDMPGMSGFELLERLTSMAPRFESIPFVFLTALGDRRSELRGWQLGADDYLTKPVDYEVLAARIGARLARVARHPSSPQQLRPEPVAPARPLPELLPPAPVPPAPVQAASAQAAPAPAPAKRVHLREREVETLTWAARGKTFEEIGTILSLSRRTVEFHLENARRKLGVATRTQALIKAATEHLIRP